MSYVKKFTKPYQNGYKNQDSTTQVTAEIKNMETDTFLAVEDYLSGTVDTEIAKIPSDTDKTRWNNKADTSAIPTKLSDLSDDANHRLVTDEEKSTWDGKAEASDIPQFANKGTLDKFSESDNHLLWDNKPIEGGGDTSVELTQAEYDALSEEEKHNGSIYFVTDGKGSDEIEEIKEELSDLKMLGWSVPKDCPIHNETDGNTFIQKVGRVDLGSLTWVYDNVDGQYCFTNGTIDNCKGADDWGTTIAKGYNSIYHMADWSHNRTYDGYDKTIAISPISSISIRNSSYSDVTTFKNAMQGVYLYYELATPITMQIDGNEAVIQLNDSLADYGMDNKFDGVYQQGAYSTDDGHYLDLYYAVSNLNKILCSAGNTVRLKYDNAEPYLFVNFFNASDGFISASVVENRDEIIATAPQGTSYFRFGIQTYINRTLTPDNALKTSVYVNNAIDQVKSELSEKHIITSRSESVTFYGTACYVEFGNIVFVSIVITDTSASATRVNFASLPAPLSTFSVHATNTSSGKVDTTINYYLAGDGKLSNIDAIAGNYGKSLMFSYIKK